MKSLMTFLEEKDIKFENQKQAVTWVKRNLSPKSLLKVGPSYLIDEKEMNQLYNMYVLRQKEIVKKKQAQARKMTALNKRRKINKEKPT